MPKKAILVTGGSGFIGSHVCKFLYQKGFYPIIFDNLSNSYPQPSTLYPFVKGDLSNQDELESVFKNFSIKAVMHFAAFIDVGESIKDPGKYYVNNVINTLNLLASMRKYAVPFLVFSSSAAVYGIPTQKYINEEHSCHPINPYGQTKLMVENILNDYDRAYGLKSISLRYFNAAGGDPDGEIKNFKKKETNLIPIILNYLKNDQAPITINGTDYPTLDGTCVRDYIHVMDIAQAHVLALENLFQGGSSNQFNLGNGSGFSIRDVIHTTESVTGKTIHAIEGPRRQGDPPILVADSKKARTELGWNPQYPLLESMIAHAWDAMKS